MAAAVEWDRRGVPDRPGAWLTTTAWRKALDRLRHERVAAAYAPELVADVHLRRVRLRRSPRWTTTSCGCSSPAAIPRSPPEARMALTLRSVAGLTVPEIARAFLSTEHRDGAAADAGAQQGHRRADPVPGAARRPAAASGCAGVAARDLPGLQRGPRGDRGPTCAPRAIRLARLLVRLMPDEAEAHGLLALLLLTDARSRGAGAPTASSSRSRSRTARAGTRRRSPRASRCSSARCGCRAPGFYAIQAAIAALHDAGAVVRRDRLGADRRALRASSRAHDPSPVVAINRAVAVGFADGPAAGLAALLGRSTARPLPAAARRPRGAAAPRG